jgi:hypothetical protein
LITTLCGNLKTSGPATSAVGGLPAMGNSRLWRFPFASSVTILGGCLLIIFGAKIWLISQYGSATPFWDQWDIEAGRLYKPYFDGTLHFWSLFDASNEHRIFFTRLLCLGLLLLERRWDPLLQMVVNAGLHVAAIGVLLVMITHELRVQFASAAAAFSAAVLAVPFGWENTLQGIQSLLYLNLLFAFLAIRLHSRSPTWSPLWILATFFAVGCYFNMASGALTPLVLSAICICQMILGSRNGGYREWTGIAAQCTLAIVMMLSIERVLHHDQFKAHSAEQFVLAFLTAGAWPLSPPFVVVLHAPMIALVASIIKDTPSLRDGRWIFFGLWIWLGTQFVSLAFGRAEAVILSPRYMDFFLIGLILNFTALMHLLSARPRLSVGLLASAWLLAVSIAATHEAILQAAPNVSERHRITNIETQNVRGYVNTGDFGFLHGKSPLEIPYPDANYLKMMLDTPEVRVILPPTLVGDGVPARQFVVSLRNLVLSHGLLLAGVGIALFVWGLVFAKASRRQNVCGGGRNKVPG